MNGEKLDEYRKPKQRQRDFPRLMNSEQAATTEKTIKKQSQPFAQSKKRKVFKAIKPFKSIIIAVITALLVGLILGIILLKVFANMDNGLAHQSTNNPVVNLDTTTKETPEDSSNEVNLPAVQASIVQGGVFTEESNAQELAVDYEDSGVASMIWEKDDQYYVITGLSSSVEMANQLAKQQEEQGVEVYVKEWDSGEIEVSLTSEEEEWLTSFHQLLTESMDIVTAGEQVAADDWVALMEQETSESDKIPTFKEQVEPWIKQIEEGAVSTNQLELLNLWYEWVAFFES